jgi:hypothetical protein
MAEGMTASLKAFDRTPKGDIQPNVMLDFNR